MGKRNATTQDIKKMSLAVDTHYEKQGYKSTFLCNQNFQNINNRLYLQIRVIKLKCILPKFKFNQVYFPI